MIIIWRGWGILAALIPFVVMAVVTSTFKNYYAEKELINLSLILSGPLIWHVGKRLNENGPSHSIFWIPFQYWGLVWGGLGLFESVKLVAVHYGYGHIFGL